MRFREGSGGHRAQFECDGACLTNIDYYRGDLYQILHFIDVKSRCMEHSGSVHDTVLNQYELTRLRS